MTDNVEPTALDTLLETRRVLDALRKETYTSAHLPEFAEMQQVTLATVMGMDMCLLAVDVQLAILTGDRAEAVRLLMSEHSSVLDELDGG